MKSSIRCTNPNCAAQTTPGRHHIIKYGFYRRRCDSKRVQRFRCQLCRQTISNQTFNPTYKQHKPRINRAVANLICSKVSMRQTGRLLRVNYKTVARKMQFLAEQARIKQRLLLAQKTNLTFIQMDEMETFEHTKCKPLSIALAVEPKTRHILAARVGIMPPKGRLAKISYKKYGPRADERKEKFLAALTTIKPLCSSKIVIMTDKKPAYRSWIKQILPHSSHITTKGRRGCIVGYGELKQGGFDPLFMLNHTAAMVRDNLARMLRRTWCTTKRVSGLEDALALYVGMHNERLMAAAQQQ